MKQAKLRPIPPVLAPVRTSIKRIAVLGLSHEETRVIQHTLAVVRARGLSYSFVAKAAEPNSATLVILDASRQSVVSHWKALKRARPELVGIAVVDSKLEGECPVNRVLKRPWTAHDLITALGELEIRTNPIPPRRASELPEFQDAHHIVLMSPPPVVTPVAMRKVPRFTGRILVIGSAATRRHLNILLVQWGLEAQTTHSATLGLKMLASRRFDAVLIETELPDSDGYQICKTVKRDSAGTPLPVIMLAAKLGPWGRFRGKLAGCSDQLVMPVGRQRLEETLARFLPVSQQGVIAMKGGEAENLRRT